MSNWRGDGGYSDLIDRKEISKSDPCFDILGTLDESSAALGVARALASTDYTRERVLNIQEHLCWMMSELALSDSSPQSNHIREEHVIWIDEQIRFVESHVPRPPTFIAPGDSIAGAALQLARTIVRRAERLVVQQDKGENHPEIVGYLNHLSALLYSLARYEDAAAGSDPQHARLMRSPGAAVPCGETK